MQDILHLTVICVINCGTVWHTKVKHKCLTNEVSWVHHAVFIHGGWGSTTSVPCKMNASMTYYIFRMRLRKMSLFLYPTLEVGSGQQHVHDMLIIIHHVVPLCTDICKGCETHGDSTVLTCPFVYHITGSCWHTTLGVGWGLYCPMWH
jgi:hypothetical protein